MVSVGCGLRPSTGAAAVRAMGAASRRYATGTTGFCLTLTLTLTLALTLTQALCNGHDALPSRTRDISSTIDTLTQEPKRLSAVVGTPNYWAPELVLLAQGHFAAHTYDAAVDNWAVGCIMYELLVGRPPFEANSEDVLFYKITDAAVDYPTHLSGEAQDLISGLLRPVDDGRITCEQAMRHPWLSSTGDAPPVAEQ